LGLSDGEEIMPLAFFFHTIPARDRRTDGQTDRQTRCGRYNPRYHSVARVKTQRVVIIFLRVVDTIQPQRIFYYVLVNIQCVGTLTNALLLSWGGAENGRRSLCGYV